MKTPRDAGRFHWGAINQKNEAITTESRLTHEKTIKPTTTSMGKP